MRVLNPQPRPALVLGAALAGLVLAACGPQGGGRIDAARGASSSRPALVGGPSSPSGTVTNRPPRPPATVTTTSSSLPPPAPGLVLGRVTVVGDSVTIDAAPALEALIPGCQVEAEVGEQWVTGTEVLAQLRAEGELGSKVVVALGTNGAVSPADFAATMALLRGVSRVVVVTDHAPQPWEEQNNALFRKEVRRYRNARLADWDALVREHPGWLYPDGTHMVIGGAGAYGFARLVRAEL